MSKPRLLDLGCCAGGCSVGYAEAGFDVTGVDIEPQPNYPYRFIQADMLTFPLEGYDAYHCSPHCQRYSLVSLWNKDTRLKYPDQIPAIRARLRATGKPYVIENIARAPLYKSIMLCGEMFGLRTYRHRHFESNILLFQPPHPKHIHKSADATRTPKPGEYWSICGHMGHKDDAQAAMGINWMKTQHEIAQAIPWKYTAWIGAQLIDALRTEREASA